jgi:hypothetical protein
MILVAILCLFAYVIWINLYKIFIINSISKKSIRQIHDEAKSGDIILCKQKHLSYIYNNFANFSHSAIIIVHPYTNKKYVVEIFRNKDKESNDIQVVPLYDKLRKYQGDLYHLRLKKTLDTEKVHQFIDKLTMYIKTNTFNHDVGKYVMTCIAQRLYMRWFMHENSNKLVCTEFVGIIMKDLGIVSESFDNKCLLPGDFRNITDDGIELYDNLSYIYPR